MIRVNPWKWEYVVLVFVVAIASYLLLVEPIVGVADQGDYSRVTYKVGLRAPDGLSNQDAYGCWLIPTWTVRRPEPVPYFSTAEFTAWAAILLRKLVTRDTAMDIRWVSGVQLGLLAGLILVILKSARRLPTPAYVAIAAGVVLVCTDSEYLAYLNSFYGESAALLGVFAFLAAAMAAATTEKPSRLHLAALVAAAAVLAGSKAQNAVMGILAAGWIVWLFQEQRVQRWASVAAGLVLIGFSGFVLAIAPSPEINLFHAIYDRVLPNSVDRQASLAELGLKPETAAWMGKLYWEPKIESKDDFPGKATRFKLAMFYVRHPMMDLQMAQEALSFSNDVDYLGNYTKDSGVACLTRTRAFVEYDRFRMRLASIWFLFPLLGLNLAAVCIWRNRVGALFTTLGAMTAAAFLIAAFFDSEPRKHLFTFNLLFDVLLFADLSAGVVGLRHVIGARGTAWAGRLKPVAALLVIVVLGMALWRDVAAKSPTVAAVSNMAFHKRATQSSALPGYGISEAGLAVDGNRDGNFFGRSVTSTNLEATPWWEVDLGASKEIGSVVIWNRTDCCPDRLANYFVFISDVPFSDTDTPGNLQTRPRTWRSFQTRVPAPSRAVATHGVRGRYVRVQLEGRGYLSLAEVEVLPFGPNLAIGQPATESSSLPGYSVEGAGAAVDGNTDGNYWRGSVSSTNQDRNAWWQVDLGESSEIASIVIWNRTDCCVSRLSHYWVFVSDTPFDASDTPETLQRRAGTWKSYQASAPDPSGRLETSGAKGRYVRVQLDGTDFLSLAEVQVFGR